jgi:Zn-dependent M28 family amino/carboxypeptidase
MRRQLKTLLITLLIFGLGGAFAAAGQESGFPNHPPKLARLVNIHSVDFHQNMLMNIAERYDGNRAAGTQGYGAAVNYIRFWLWTAGYDVEVQEFDFPFFQESGDPLLQQTSPAADPYTPNDPDGFYTMTYSGSGDVAGQIEAVDLVMPPGAEPSTSTSGCEPEDFTGFTAANIALIQRGSCSFYQKALNAQEAGARAVIIFNEGQEGRTDAIRGTLGSPEFDIPVVFTSHAIGAAWVDLLDSQAVSVNLATDTIAETRTSQNILAASDGGDPANTLIVGAHLDSVLDGPGINDNGSGTAAVLEAALKMGWWRLRTDHKVVFAFWGAEELGLIGSEYFVGQLSAEELAEIALYLNFDMIASPNYVRFVYDGDGSATELAGPPGSGAIEAFFVDLFAGKGLATEPTALDGRSDYEPFMSAGIPIGGLFTGAGGIKTEEEAAIYGGTAGAPYDANYHTAEDNLDNINLEVEQQNLKAMAQAIDHFAKETLPEVPLRTMGALGAAEAPMRSFKGPLAVR